MSTPFGKTLRSIERERSAIPAWFAISSAGALSAWIAWSLLAEVPLVETTASGRIQYRGAVHEIESPVGARVRRRAVDLGSRVEAGDVLIELDGSEVSLELDKEQAEKRRRELELVALTAQIAAHTEALETSRWRGRAGVREAIAERREQVPKYELSRERIRRLKGAEAGSISELEVLERRADLDSTRASLSRMRARIRRLGLQSKEHVGAKLAELKALEREAARIEGELIVAARSIDLLAHRLEQHRIRAPVSGTIEALAELREGAVVKEGERIATVVASGDLQVTAEFPARTGVGRIGLGQPAIMRLHGYPWTQYGVVRARVEQVGNQPEGTTIRVVASVVASPRSVSLHHGMAGQVDVEVERVSPMALLVRAFGARLGDGGRHADP